MLSKDSINCKHLLLGLLLDILVVVVFLLIYHAYIVAPRLKTEVIRTTQPAGESAPTDEINLP